MLHYTVNGTGVLKDGYFIVCKYKIGIEIFFQHTFELLHVRFERFHLFPDLKIDIVCAG